MERVREDKFHNLNNTSILKFICMVNKASFSIKIINLEIFNALKKMLGTKSHNFWTFIYCVPESCEIVKDIKR